MDTKQGILGYFEKNRGKSISGSELAKSLNVSRNAVWKAVKALQGEGYKITARTNQGYTMSPETDILSEESIRKYLLPEMGAVKFSIHGALTSTNDAAKKLAAAGEPEWHIVIASHQTHGRGRRGRSFYSPDGTGLYMSVLLRPRLDAESSLMITTCAAAAAAAAIEAVTSRAASIKWVNDVFLGDKKVCGILTEASVGLESGGLEYAVLGIGINILPPDEGFPRELEDIAGALFTRRDYKPDDSSRLTALILNRLWEYYNGLNNGSYNVFFEEYKKRSMVIGKNVTVIENEKQTAAFAEDIDEKCRLHVVYEDGTRAALSSGEVSLGKDGRNK